MPNWTKEQSQAIYTEGNNILVSAGAGSGKTAVLSERVLRKVKDGVNIDEILILTFTKAAAYEMMIRIRNKLKKEGLLEQVNRIDKAYITTFDSYALSVVNKYHDRLNLGKNISIIDENSINLYKIEVLDKIFLEYYESNNELFNKLISDFCLRDDKELKSYILKLNNTLDLKYDKVDYLNNYITNYYSDDYINTIKEEYTKLVFNQINIINNLLDRLSLEIDGDSVALFYDELSKILEAKTYEEIRNNLDIKLPRLPKNSGEGASSIKDNIKKTIEYLNTLCLYDIEDEINDYKSTKDYVEVIIEIILKLDKIVFDYKKENNTFEFVDISKLAIDIVKNNEDIRCELTNFFNEIMIDEYQDTSDLQETFINLIANKNTYMVGDIKQSIYRFRNANPLIFKEKYLKYENNVDGIKIDLNKNFRSREEVLSSINQIFNSVMDVEFGGADYIKSHQMQFGNNTYINEGKTNQNYDIDIYNYTIDKESDYTKFTKDEIEAFIIADDIKNKIENKYKIFDKDTLILRDINYSDFVILIDKSSKFTLYKKIFEYCKIPLTILKDINISSEDEVYLIRNILKLIECVNNNDNHSNTFKYCFTSISRSYLYRYSDDYIFDVINNNRYNETDILEKVNKISKEINNYDLKTLIEVIKYEFDFDSKMITASNIEIRQTILEYFINLCSTLEELNYDYHMFIKYLDDIIDNKREIKIPLSVVDENSVSIMTIHKSKGLEYPICYYSGISNLFNISDLKEKIMFDNKYGIITPSYINGYKDIFVKTLVKDNYLKEEISEKIRLFYVALTRCKEKMIVVCNLSSDDNLELNNNIKEKYRSFLDILNSIKDKLEDYIVDIDLDKVNITSNYRIKTINSTLEDYDYENINVNEYSYIESDITESSFSKKNNKLLSKEEINKMQFGTRIHELFEIVDFKNSDLDKLDISDKEKEYITNFLNQDLIKNIENANILKEYEFYIEEDNELKHGIIDLMLEYDDYIDIIDYKLKNTEDSEYEKQLSGYKEYIKNKTNKEVNIYLYSIINNEFKKL